MVVCPELKLLAALRLQCADMFATAGWTLFSCQPHLQLRRGLVHIRLLQLTLGAPQKTVEFLGIRQLRRTQPELPVSAPDQRNLRTDVARARRTHTLWWNRLTNHRQTRRTGFDQENSWPAVFHERPTWPLCGAYVLVMNLKNLSNRPDSSDTSGSLRTQRSSSSLP